jgi:zinc/manganese transport system permease protein
MTAWFQQNLFDMMQNDQVAGALQAGLVVAAVSAIVGFFVVLRGLSFIGHAVTDIGFTGGAGAGLLGINALWGLLAFCIGAALGVGMLGDRARERDVATGVVLSLSLGIGALFLYMNTRYVDQPFTLLFGSIFGVDSDTTRHMVVVGVACLLALAALYRPLLACSVSPQVAAARGVPVRTVSALFLVCMAVAVAEAAQVVGVLLSTALLIGPPATAAFVAKRPSTTMMLAVVIGMIQVWAGITLAYDSYYWPPGGKGWPVSFFITSLVLVSYLVARFSHPASSRQGSSRAASAVGAVNAE